ncbi:hypothetical protein NPA31_002835 [Aurantimonas sp. MSK8Z-1]|uniref:hypothetical protein n=1 Tax=Mangrovibrevibacter kandeliae TaxID=2968473 RepID=UPI002118B6F6|nr:hypothetical protein [Aurantimonas sp. MSK8Z-1]MCW4113899.1 hypothetical protein [Aurantimonas sp. MSK8Z-1]
MLHDHFGLLADGQDYAAFVEAINSDNNNLFVSGKIGFQGHPTLPFATYDCTIPYDRKTTREPGGCSETEAPKPTDRVPPKWRGWESPRAGHVYELEGPDAGSVGMAPAPRIGSSELAAEVAELYALALLRDVPFTAIVAGDDKTKLCDGGDEAIFSGQDIVDLLNTMPFYTGVGVRSSTATTAGATGLNRFERHRRFARTQDPTAELTAPLTTQTVFRGSTPGALRGPYLSQFMLIGSPSPAGATLAAHPSTTYGIADGYVRYGTLVIDQRAQAHRPCLDHLTEWWSWRDAQNGADFRGQDLWLVPHRRFITTPRDLASYVHFDALYEAYLNAVLILDSMKIPTSRGFPEPSFAAGDFAGRRTGFATFGGPHILSLVTEVATRCLKAVRRQKFNFHRRCRPEAIGGRLTLLNCKEGGRLGCAERDFRHLLNELPEKLRAAVIDHNKAQNGLDPALRHVLCTPPAKPDFQPHEDCNLLLPMAFPEGSPMHPAYGAGHATVAGGCVTMIKAFFEMFEDCDGSLERPLCWKGQRIAYVPKDDGSALIDDPASTGVLTIQGELDKLAANIAIGRNMAGVHYYSDYYDSLRLGERVAVGILLEQAPTYGDPIQSTFTSFDGDRITITGQADSAPALTIIDRLGNPVAPRDWWLRHVIGEQIILDL